MYIDYLVTDIIEAFQTLFHMQYKILTELMDIIYILPSNHSNALFIQHVHASGGAFINYKLYRIELAILHTCTMINVVIDLQQ